MNRSFLPLLMVIVIDACTSGKTALKKGDYYEAVLESVHRLRSSPENKKAKAVLLQGYPLAIEYTETNIQNGIKADDPMKWRNAVTGYEQINHLNDEIKTSIGARNVITNPVTRYKELAEAKGKAAEESYLAGINSLMKNTREDAKEAYFDFKAATTFEPGYKESIEMMNQAEFNATLRVAYEEVNASRINYGSLQPVINSLQRQFLSFKPIGEKDTVPPHQNLKIIFVSFQEDSRATITTTSEELKRDIKVDEKKGADGKTQDVMQTVTAKVTYFHKTKRASSNGTFTISDVSTGAILQNQNIDGNASWQYDWATYTGDIRALNTSQQNLSKLKETSPGDRFLFNQSMSNLQANLGSQLKSFYSKY